MANFINQYKNLKNQLKNKFVLSISGFTKSQYLNSQLAQNLLTEYLLSFK